MNLSTLPQPSGLAESPPQSALSPALVSVIVPTFNRPQWLRATLDSILAQTCRDFEIIVVNDAGVDVRPIVEACNAGDRIRIINHRQNQGLAAARNTGVRAARGEYVAYLDDDDVFLPHHLQTLVDHLEATRGDVAYTDAYRAHQRKNGADYEIFARDIPYSLDFDNNRILQGNFIPVLCFMHRKSCWEAVGGFDESLPVLEDWDLWIRMSRLYTFTHLPTVTCEFRWRTDGSSMTVAGRAKFRGTADIIRAKFAPAPAKAHPETAGEKNRGEANPSAGPAPVAPASATEMEFAHQLFQFFNSQTAAVVNWNNPQSVRVTAIQAEDPTTRPLDVNTDPQCPRWPFPEAAFDTVVCVGALNETGDTVLPAWLGEFYRLTAEVFWVVLDAGPGRNRTWWEQRFFAAGFRKHPLATKALSPAELGRQEGRITFVFGKVPPPALTRFPLGVLARDRHLRTDMLRETGPRSEAHLARYQLAAAYAKDGDIILDGACGLGYGSAILARQFPRATVIGVDNSEFAINYARENFAAILPNLEFHRADLNDLNWLAGRKITYLVSFETLEHLADPDQFLRRITQQMPPDARFLGSVSNKWVDGTGKNSDPSHLQTFDLEKICGLASRHFQLTQIFRQNAEHGTKGDHGRILRPVMSGQVTADDEQNAEWWLLAGEGLAPAIPAPVPPEAVPVPTPVVPTSQETEAPAPAMPPEFEFARQLSQFFNCPTVLALNWANDQRVRLTPFHLNGPNVPPSQADTDPACPRLPVADAAFDTVVSVGTLSKVSEAALSGWLAELHRVTRYNLWVVVEALHPRNYSWWEARFAAAGFRPHPCLPELHLRTPAPDSQGPLTFVLENVPGAPVQSPAPRTQTICLATNYLLMTEPTRQMWADLGQRLGEQGCQLVLLSTNEPKTPLPFPVYHHPYLMRDFAAAIPDAGLKAGVSATPREMEWLAEDLSRVPGGYPLSEALTGLAACRLYLRELLRQLQPGQVTIADNTLCQTALMHQVCLEAGVPVQIYERGLLPETLMLETRGIQAWSDMRTHWLAQDLPASASDPLAFERIRSYYLARKPQKYAQADFGEGGGGVRRQLGLEGKKVVLFLGGGYEANGHAPKGGIYERHFFAGFPTTEQALAGLWEAIKKIPNTALVFKPHPLDPQSYSVAKIQGAVVVRDLNVHALIDAADVVAAQYTTLQFEAALYDKPVLLLARSAWWGRNAAYEVESPEDLPSKLDAALQRHDWPAHQTNARTFITWMMDQVLVGCTPEVPARRNLQDLAKFIARTAIDARSLPSAPARCQQAEQSLPWLRRVSAAGSALPTNTVSPAAATQSPEPAAPAVVADRRTVEFVDQATRQIVGGIRDFNDVPELWDAIAQLPSSANRAIYELCTAALANARPARSSRENHAQAILASLAGYHAGIKSLDELRAVSDKLLLVESQSALISGFHFRVVKLADPENPILKLENFVCQMPFVELDILSATSHLCCASWLQKSAGNMAAQDYPEVWNSPAAQAIRQSVLDGSYRYCNKNACPLIMQGKLDKKEVMLKDPWWADVIKNGKGVIDRPPKMVNLAYDSHCNLHCPSCRSSVITTNDSEREKLDAITQRNVYPLLATAESVYVTGSGDPFASKTFRKLLGWISHETCPKLKVRLMTNGLLFTEKEWARFPNLKGKIRCVRVSVDGATKETHELLRRGSRWETMMENLPFIGALLKQGEIDAYDLVFVVQRDNYREMGDFVDLAMRVGANRACFERITNWGTFSPEQFQHKAVFNSGHPEFPEFVKVMQDKRLSGPNVFIGSFAPFLPS